MQLCHDVLVNEAGIDHGDDAECLGIGDAAPADHATFYAELCGEGGGCAPASVHEDFGAGYGGKVIEEGGELGGVFDDGSADFDDRLSPRRLGLSPRPPC